MSAMLWSLGWKNHDSRCVPQPQQQKNYAFREFPFFRLIFNWFSVCLFFVRLFVFTVSEASVPHLFHILLNCITELRLFFSIRALISFVIIIRKWVWTCITINRYCFIYVFPALASCYFHPNLELLFTVHTRLPNKQLCASQFAVCRATICFWSISFTNKRLIVESGPQMSDI